MADTTLRRARALLAAGRHAEAIALLEPLVLEYREDASYFGILGKACLRSGDHGGAFTYLSRAFDADPDDVNVALEIAAIQLKRGSAQKALDMYLAVLERRPSERRARRALEAIRRNPEPEALDRWLSPRNFASLLPPVASPLRFLPLLATVPVVILVGFLILQAIHAAERAAYAARPSVAGIALSDKDREKPAEFGGQYRYVMSEDEILATFARAKSLFMEFRDQRALVELNRILGSNASPGVKAKAAELASFTEPPTFLNVKDALSWAEVSSDPGLHSGCAVVWSGRMTNFSSGNGAASFDFLVGYGDQKRLEGIVRVDFPFELKVDPGRVFEVLGVVRPAGNGFTLGGVAIHEMAGP